MKRIGASQSGFTLVELLIAGLMASIISFASFEFYKQMHNTTLTQEDIADMQLTTRNTLEEMGKTLSNAGFKVSVDGYAIVSDTLKIFYQGTNPVDSVKYFLTEFSETEYARIAGRTPEMTYYKLMRTENNGAALEFATNVKSLTYNVVNPNTIDIVLTVYARRVDETYSFGDGFRELSATQRVYMRNL